MAPEVRQAPLQDCPGKIVFELSIKTREVLGPSLWVDQVILPCLQGRIEGLNPTFHVNENRMYNAQTEMCLLINKSILITVQPVSGCSLSHLLPPPPLCLESQGCSSYFPVTAKRSKLQQRGYGEEKTPIRSHYNFHPRLNCNTMDHFLLRPRALLAAFVDIPSATVHQLNSKL